MHYICIVNSASFKYDDVCVPPERQVGKDSHPQWELSYILLGKGEREIGDCRVEMEEGEVVLIPPDIPHVWMFDPAHTDKEGNIANISVFFESKMLTRIGTLFPEYEDVIRTIMEQREAISYTGESLLRIRSLLTEMRNRTAPGRLPIFLELLRVISLTDTCVSAGSIDHADKIEHRYEKIRVYCRCNYARNISLEEAALHVGMNKSAFCTFMRRYAGMSFTELLNSVRLRKASEMLLDTDRTIASIAYDVGYSNVAYFNRLFKKKYKQTPGQMRKNIVSPEIRRYVEDQIIPRYEAFDKAHQADHVEMVINQSLRLADLNPGIDRDMAYVVAAFHDLGLINGRENHHIDSRKILESDEFLKSRFSESQIRIMGEAVEDHRASKGSLPRNDYGLIVAEADRFIDCDTILRRTIQYGLRNYPELDKPRQFQRALDHLKAKYGRGGYLKIWMPGSENEARLEALRQIIDNSSLLQEKLERIYEEESEVNKEI